MRIVMMIGVSGSGKTTYLKDFTIPVHSTDKYVEEYARQNKLGYIEAFSEVQEQRIFGKFVKKFYQEIESSISKNEDFAIDRTNLSRTARIELISQMRFLASKHGHEIMIEGHYTDLPFYEIFSRMEQRVEKRIIPRVVARQIVLYEIPKKNEGFDILKRIG